MVASMGLTIPRVHAGHGDRTIADTLAWTIARAAWIGQKPPRKKEVPSLSLAWRRQQAVEHERKALAEGLAPDSEPPQYWID
jgi:hypothetical protein